MSLQLDIPCLTHLGGLPFSEEKEGVDWWMGACGKNSEERRGEM